MKVSLVSHLRKTRKGGVTENVSNISFERVSGEELGKDEDSWVRLRSGLKFLMGVQHNIREKF